MKTLVFKFTVRATRVTITLTNVANDLASLLLYLETQFWSQCACKIWQALGVCRLANATTCSSIIFISQISETSQQVLVCWFAFDVCIRERKSTFKKKWLPCCRFPQVSRDLFEICRFNHVLTYFKTWKRIQISLPLKRNNQKDKQTLQSIGAKININIS